MYFTFRLPCFIATRLTASCSRATGSARQDRARQKVDSENHPARQQVESENRPPRQQVESENHRERQLDESVKSSYMLIAAPFKEGAP